MRGVGLNCWMGWRLPRVAALLVVLLLVACSEDGKRFSALGVDLRQHAYLQLEVIQPAGSQTTEVCASFLRSAKRGDWIGEYIQTWWELTQQQSLSVNGKVLKQDFKRQPANFFYAPRHYCAELPPAEQYHLEWRDLALGHVAALDVSAMPALQPTLVRDSDQTVQIQWQLVPQSGEQLYLDIRSSEPELPIENNGLYSEWPNHAAGQVHGSSGELRLHPQTEAITVRFMHTRLDRTALLGFAGAGNQLHLYRETDARLTVPGAP